MTTYCTKKPAWAAWRTRKHSDLVQAEILAAHAILASEPNTPRSEALMRAAALVRQEERV